MREYSNTTDYLTSKGLEFNLVFGEGDIQEHAIIPITILLNLEDKGE